jgi:hypothetical protein
MKKDLYKIFLFFIFFVAVILAAGHISFSIIEYKFKGAICHNIDEEECIQRYSMYKRCVQTLELHKELDQDFGRNLCFRTAFFDISQEQ